MQSNQTFLSISPAECERIFPSVFINAAQLQKAGQLLADNKMYGPAISLTILGAEEYVKSLCLYLEGKGFQLRDIKAIQGIFSQHTARHRVMRDTFSVWIVLKDLLSLSRKSTRKQILQTSALALLNIFSAISNHEWWQQADDLKNKGLYANYRNGLILPDSLTNEEFLNTIKFTKSIPTEIQSFVNRLNKMDIQELKGFITLFKEAQIDQLIEESILTKRRPE